MALCDRIQKYINVEKGPTRTLEKIQIGDTTLYAHANGIAIFETDEEAELDEREFKVISVEKDYTIVQIKKLAREAVDE